MPQEPGLGPHQQPSLPLVEMWEQHLELQNELVTDHFGDAHITTTSRITGSNTLILCEPLEIPRVEGKASWSTGWPCGPALAGPGFADEASDHDDRGHQREQ